MNNEFEKDLDAPKKGKAVVVDDSTPPPDQWEDRNVKFVKVDNTEEQLPEPETPPVPFVKLEDGFTADDEDPELLLDTGGSGMETPELWFNDPIDVEVSEAQTNEDEAALEEG